MSAVHTPARSYRRETDATHRPTKEAMSKTLRASRTAVLVCQGRAAADGLIAAGRFADPTAMPLLRADEQETVRWVRDGCPCRDGMAASGSTTRR